MNDNIQNQMIYLASREMVKKLFKEGIIDKQFAERLNRRNAESQMCDFLPIG